METNESCKCCEKMVMTVETSSPLRALLDLPNTFDRATKKYAWRRHTMLMYAMVPQSVHGKRGSVDLYVCLDEDLLDDIDLRALAREFIDRAILPEMTGVTSIQLSVPVLSAPKKVGCWKLHHHVLEETA